MESRSRTATRTGPALRDWALLGVSLVFCAAAVAMFPPNWRLAAVTLAVFGGCALLFAATIRRKRRARSFPAVATDITVQGGVDLRLSRARPIALGALVAVIGLVIAGVDPTSPWLLRACGAFIAVTGVVVALGYATGLLGGLYLRFESTGLVLGRRRYSVLVPWDGIHAVSVFEFSDNACVRLVFAHPPRNVVEPPGRAVDFESELRRSHGMYGMDVVLMTAHFGLDAPPLAAAIRRYVADADARAELRAGPRRAAGRP